MFKKKLKTEMNFLELIPEQTREFLFDEAGKVTVCIPKFENKFLVRYLVPLMKSNLIKVKLDDFGSCVWQHCDGRKTVAQIGEVLREQYGEQVEPVFDRLTIFFQNLYRLKFIHYINYETK